MQSGGRAGGIIFEEAARTPGSTRPVGIMLLAILHYIPDLGGVARKR